MKYHSFALFAALLLGTSTLLGGCATTGMDRSVKTSNSIKEVDTEIRKMVVQVDATGAALDALVLPGQANLKKTFDKYTDEVARLDNEGQRLLKRIEEMKERKNDYFAEWEKQGDTFVNPQIRELSEERRNRLMEIYAQVPAASVGIKGAYHSYLTDLKEIQQYLSNDLTPKGIEGIAPVAQKSVQDREALKASIKPLVVALDAIKAELYSGKK